MNTEKECGKGVQQSLSLASYQLGPEESSVVMSWWCHAEVHMLSLPFADSPSFSFETFWNEEKSVVLTLAPGDPGGPRGPIGPC